MSKDYYNILGIDKNASQEDIKKAFRKLAHQHHPDKSGGNVDKFKEINEAYQVLGDQKKREQYDRFGPAFENMQGGRGFGGFDGFRDFTGYANGFEVNLDDLGDLFGGIGDVFGFGRSARTSAKSRARRGRDIEIPVHISFKEAVFGTDKEIKVVKNTACPSCGGSGAEPGSKPEACPSCGGSGRIRQAQRTIFGAMQVETSCQKCEGEGRVITEKCKKCSGSGVIRDEVRLNVRIPAGVSSGESIRLAGQGESGQRGAQAGDLYIRLEVETDPKFRRQGDDIHTVAEISIAQAALGDKVEIETVDGPVKLKIPEGTQPGKVFILRDKGIPHLRSRGRGSHFVEVKVRIPTGLSRKQKESLKDLGI